MSARACTRSARRLRHSFQLHTVAPQSASPVPHPSVAGPPPPPPTPDVAQPEDRVARKRKQAELLQRGLSLRPNPAKPATALQKRFWKAVSIKETPDGHQIFLDSRPVRTASKNVLTLPLNKSQLAAAIALEWDLLVTAQQALKHHYIPLTSFTSRAVDITNADLQGNQTVREDIVTMVMRYLDTDTLLCWAPEQNRHTGKAEQREEGSESLRSMQERTAQPIIAYLTTTVWPGAEIQPSLSEDSILPTPQPQVTMDIIRGWISGLQPFDLAGLERAVLATKSLLVASRLLVEWSHNFQHLRDQKPDAPRFGIEQAAEAASIEVRWQTGMWGEVEDTHDVEKEDMKRQLGSVILMVHGDAR
ncbi:ATP12-domain-containing protein [Rhizodiscina lignyota]|uniref:ATP12-domain-containing protein n=1 Tax=Rhizodiscina lignyota TaxID=1504668 RepID=A0A9P4MAZ4_9PEZI|nr:ATP12-domain-containing protein [Rhizodiscina lignyota]